MMNDRLRQRLNNPIPWLFLVTAVGAYLRISDLSLRSLWYDEAVLFHLANTPFAKVIAANAAGNSAPPLYALLVRTVLTFGSSETVLRSISCLAGIMAIPLMFALGRHFLSPRLAIFPALLVALSPQQIYYSTQLREYSLAFLLAIWLMLAFLLFMEKASWPMALHLGAVFAIAIFCQYGLGLLIAALNVVCILFLLKRSPRPQADLLLWGMAQLCGVLAVVGVYFLALKTQFGSGGFGASYLAHGYGDGTWLGLVKLIGNTGDILSFAFPTFLFPLLCCLGVFEVIRDQHAKNWCALGFFVVPFAVTLGAAAAKWYPYLGERQGIFLTPITYLFAAIGLSFLGKVSPHLRSVQALFILVAVSVGLYTRMAPEKLPGTASEHLRPVVSTLTAAQPAAQDIIYVYYGAIPAFEYYTRGLKLPWVAGVSSRGNMEGYFRQVDALLARNARIWLVFSHVWSNEAEQILQYVQMRRPARLLREEQGAWLFVVE